ncbi:carbonic anhydrase [Photobacterium sp. OFAV2-7]|uniref:carbonic anhydrase n=1 Tax=Photobacterium sp. OFAV2-7 TaxID=2917748 RepID=UPI001EF5FE90|nr:carbonic anhydrase family protein [Photobacterium sp. OFAV2-7]MCG7585572.1 carbonic anhydrase family protein [Photobacterium sp. OFAV2-7]
MKKTQLAIATIGILLSASVLASEDKWGYTGEHGPEHWGDTYPTCSSGSSQSPVNITQPSEAELLPLDIQYQGKVSALTNNGHTVQAQVEGLNTLFVDGKSFELKQFHFHTPSENFIKNRQYPLEAHFVHADEKGNLAVVAVMFQADPAYNKSLSSLLAEIPSKHDEIKLEAEIKPSQLLPSTEHYYRFSGSLTTPPCSEGVRWFVLQEPVPASSKRISMMHEVMGDNNRPLQPLNARVVIEK